MNVFDFFKKNGIDTVDKTFFTHVERWRSWYKGDVASFHYYKVYNGKNKINRKRKTMGMAKKVCEDVADLLLNERVKITVSDEKTNEYIQKILEDNNFVDMGNEYQERKAATGTVAYVPYFDNAVVDEEGNIISADIKINYVEARNIYPLSWQNHEVTECAFVFTKTVKQKRYAQFQFHKLQEVNGLKQYVIENRVVRATAGAGKEIPKEEWGDYPPFANMADRIETGSREPQFVIDRLNIANNVDDDDSNPMGISVFANAIPVLMKIDLEYDSYANEFELGRKRLFVKGEAINFIDGRPQFDSNDLVFYQLTDETQFGENKGKIIEESNMTIRADEHSKAINDDLNYLSMKCGFGTDRYKFEKGTVTTATQVISENSDMYRTIKKHELILDSVIKQLVSIIIRMGVAAGNTELIEDDKIEVTIDFDDSIIEDKSAERQQDRQDVAMGVMKHEEYRAKWYGETIEKAKQNLPEQNQVIE